MHLTNKQNTRHSPLFGIFVDTDTRTRTRTMDAHAHSSLRTPALAEVGAMGDRDGVPLQHWVDWERRRRVERRALVVVGLVLREWQRDSERAARARRRVEWERRRLFGDRGRMVEEDFLGGFRADMEAEERAEWRAHGWQ